MSNLECISASKYLVRVNSLFNIDLYWNRLNRLVLVVKVRAKVETILGVGVNHIKIRVNLSCPGRKRIKFSLNVSIIGITGVTRHSNLSTCESWSSNP